MKKSIFDMTFVLSPMIEMPQVEKDMPKLSHYLLLPWNACM